ncbi:MAG: sulfatase-like hydrolase/transferase [Deltaproteobacteria bacterium]|nr:sulfatase-like hydrolase/transferase [Deltaproteobacteria bacterium]
MRRTLGLAALALGAAAWALWPVADPRWAIAVDAEAARAAERFLHDATSAASDTQPNVVVIVADDLGKYDTPLYGAAPVATPNLARLADGGVRFTAGYVTSPVCSPSRAALLTGRYAQRFGFELLTHDRYPRNRLEWWVARTFFSTHGWHALARPTAPSAADMRRQGIPAGEITLAQLLRTRGYRTGIFGKWHLGFGPDVLPAAKGFETQYGFYDAFSLYGDPGDPNLTAVHQRYFADRYQWWRGRSGGSAIRRNGTIVDEREYLTAAIAREASAWIVAQRDAPFFAYVPFNAPHAPLQAPRRYVERLAGIDDPDRRTYYGMVAALDDGVGEILAALDRAGVAERTLVFFLSDNGAAAYMGIVDNAPLAGGKLGNFEGGVNVPFVLRWPARIASAQTFAHPVSALDVFATAASAAGAALPADRAYDGVDLVPFVTGARRDPPHAALFWRTAGHQAVRAGAYKLILDDRTGVRVLYDLVHDPYERADLAAREPARAAALARLLADWASALAPPRWPPAMEYRFTVGGERFVFPL